ncbi:MAG: hypothetical protein VCB25_08890 [Myxococcota bacterium]
MGELPNDSIDSAGKERAHAERSVDSDPQETSSAPTPDPKKNYDRNLGVIEAIMVVTHSCPNGRVVTAAKGALEAIKTGGSDSLKQQAYFVLTAIQGWRGDRAHQVHRSLRLYLGIDSEN